MLKARRFEHGEAADPMAVLALQVVKQAIKDARNGKPGAALWLRDGAGGIFEVFDVDAGRVEAALNRPKRGYRGGK